MALGKRPLSVLALLLVPLTAAPPLFASPVSDFQARLAQTRWNLAAVEGVLRPQPASPTPAPTPEMLASYLDLLSQNVEALSAQTPSRLTDVERRVVAEALNSVATALEDEAALAGIRGLTAVRAQMRALESRCRNALP